MAQIFQTCSIPSKKLYVYFSFSVASVLMESQALKKDEPMDEEAMLNDDGEIMTYVYYLLYGRYFSFY